ncbi:MAG TPA: hypothetical protein VL551_11680 [Actinospica sp.]|jgi:hypothetical protein|nr:hypothetical protein [Actinospica sp.]
MSTIRRPSRKRTIGMSVRIEREFGITQVTGNVVYVATADDTFDPTEVGRIFNPSYTDHGHDAQQYADLRVAAYITDGRVYGTRHEFHTNYGIELGRALSMARVLRRIETRLHAQGRTYVDICDFPGHLLAVADAIGAEFFAYRPEERGPLARTDAAGITRVLAELLPARPNE